MLTNFISLAAPQSPMGEIVTSFVGDGSCQLTSNEMIAFDTAYRGL